MLEVFAIVIACLAFVSFYLLTSKNVFRMLLGFLLLSQAVHLFLFTRGPLVFAVPNLLEEGRPLAPGSASDPLIQALILTAIVISFAMMSFASAMFIRSRKERLDEG